MIAIVAPTPAIDITYTVDRLEPGAVHRTQPAEQRPGGKGGNVARVLRALDRHVVVAGVIGGLAGDAVAAGLDSHGIEQRNTRVAGQTRRTVTVVDHSGGATAFHEPGPPLTPGDWARLLTDVVDLLGTAKVLVCSGSLPPGSPDDALVAFIEAARHAGVPTIVDTGARPLRHALAAGASVVKPNAQELADATGITDPVQAAHALRGASPTTVVASLGPAGLVAVADWGVVRVRPARVLSGNPTGAGDSVVAALAAGLEDRRGWPHILRDAAALASATVLAPVAGEFDPSAYEHIHLLTDLTDLTEI